MKSREEELEKERLQAEREAKLARLEKRISTRKLEVAKNHAKVIKAELGAELAETEAEKKDMAKALKKMERERIAMEHKIAELEGANGAMNMMIDGYVDETYMMTDQNNIMSQQYVMQNGMGVPQPPPIGFYDGGMAIDHQSLDSRSINSQTIFPPPINVVALNSNETVDDYVTLPPPLQDEHDQPASWLANDISRRVDYQNDYGYIDPLATDGSDHQKSSQRHMDSSRKSRSSHSRDKTHSHSRSHSNERHIVDPAQMKPRSLENLAEYNTPVSHHGHSRHHRKSRSSENLDTDRLCVSEHHHGHRSTRHAAHMVDYTGAVSGMPMSSRDLGRASAHSSSGRKERRSRSREGFDRSAPDRSKSDRKDRRSRSKESFSRSAPDRSKSDSVRYA
jgi:hypothetical protein